MDHKPVQRAGEASVEAPEVFQLVPEDAGWIPGSQKATGDHQRVTANPDIGPLQIDHEPAPRQRQRLEALRLEMLHSVLIGQALAL